MTKYIITLTMSIICITYGIAQQRNLQAKPLARQIEALIKAQNYDKAERLLKAYQAKLAKVDRLILRAQVDSFQYRARQSNQQIAHLFANHAKEIAPVVKQKLLCLKFKNDKQLKHFQNVSESVNEIIDESPRPLRLVPNRISWFRHSCRYFEYLSQVIASTALNR